MEDKLLVEELVGSMKRRKLLAKHNNYSGGLFISEDIMIEIFLCLPLKSLIGFKRLSKRWYFLITDNNSYFRHNYLSTLSSTRNRRIVGRSDDDDAIMAGFFYLKPLPYRTSKETVRFLPNISTKFKKYSFFLPPQGGGRGESSKTTEINNNPFLSFEESLDKFLSARIHEDEESHPLVVVGDRKTFVAASSNGFLFFTLCSGFSHIIDFLVNPVTMEWLPLPKLEPVNTAYVGFVCKGDYPSLDLVEYTIVRLSWLDQDLLFQLLSSSTNNEWIEYRVSPESLVDFVLCETNYTMIVSQGGGGGGGSRILVYFLVKVRRTMAIAIVVIDLNEGDESLQMFETPGLDRGIEPFYGANYITESDDGVIHYVRFFCCSYFEFWVLNTKSGEWYLKHKATLKMMLSKNVALMDVIHWPKTNAHYHIHAFHPMNPNLIFLTLYGKFGCYNVETCMFEVVYDFSAQNMNYDYSHFVYQWPCWPPLL